MTTRYGRTTQKPKLFSELTFKSGSGFSGCDSYDRSYDDGKICNSTNDDFRESKKDFYQSKGDRSYEAALEIHIKTETATNKLPLDMARVIQSMVQKTCYQNDVEFIVQNILKSIV